jgi:hypothetical protein
VDEMKTPLCNWGPFACYFLPAWAVLLPWESPLNGCSLRSNRNLLFVSIILAEKNGAEMDQMCFLQVSILQDLGAPCPTLKSTGGFL